jgi:hypothetical protein
VPVRRLDPRAHGAQGLRDPLHRPPRERLVADELEAPVLPGEDSRQEAHERSRVAAVERAGGLSQPAQARAADPHALAVDLDFRSERPHGGRGRERVLRGPEPVDLALAVGDRAEHERAVRDGLVAGDGDVAPHRHRRVDAHQRGT